MKKQETEHTDFEFEIRMKGIESQIIQDVDLSQSCWDYIFEIEQKKPVTAEDWGDCSILDDLMQNYFTWKLIYKENGLDITDKMADVEEFIIKYLKQFHAAIYMDEVRDTLPKIEIKH